jgi:hypothetical protein
VSLLKTYAASYSLAAAALANVSSVSVLAVSAIVVGASPTLSPSAGPLTVTVNKYSSKGLDGGGIAGTVIGVLAFTLLFVLAVMYCCGIEIFGCCLGLGGRSRGGGGGSGGGRTAPLGGATAPAPYGGQQQQQQQPQQVSQPQPQQQQRPPPAKDPHDRGIDEVYGVQPNASSRGAQTGQQQEVLAAGINPSASPTRQQRSPLPRQRSLSPKEDRGRDRNIEANRDRDRDRDRDRREGIESPTGDFEGLANNNNNSNSRGKSDGIRREEGAGKR